MERFEFKCKCPVSANPEGTWVHHVEAETEIARLRRERDAACKRSEYWKAEHLAGNEEIAELTRARDEAVRVAVWAAKHQAEVAIDDEDRWRLLYFGSRDDGLLEGNVYCDTDADIYRALREAMGGEGGGDGNSKP